MAEPETGMKKAEMKKLLRRSFGEGMGCAVGVGENPSFGLFIMHRVRRGKALEKMLKDEFPDAKNVRFGTAFVNEDEPKKVHLSLNRAAPGIARKLVKTFKGTGFTKVVIASDDGETEDCEEADETPEIADEEDAPATAAPAMAEAAPPPPPPASAPPAPPPPPRMADRPDPAELTKRLGGLIPRIATAAGGDAARAAALGKLAKDAGVNLKTNNLKTSADLIEQLARELDEAAPAATPATPELNKGALGSRLSTAISGLNKLPPGDHKAALTRLASQAGAQIKADGLGDASETLDRLERELAAPPPPPPPPAASPTKGTLGAQLSTLISELNQLPPGEQKAALTRLASQAGAHIKADELPAAADALARLNAGLRAPEPAAGAAEKLAKVRIDWAGVRDEVAADVGRLADALAATYAGQPFAKEISDRFKAKADPVLSRLDGRLGLAVDGVINAPDTAAREKAADAARGVVADFQAFATSDPFIADLDSNPFVPLSIRSKTTAALAAVSAAIG